MAEVTALASQNANYAKSTNSKDKLAADMNNFLTLLTSQMKNQDPLSPMDSTEFTNQLVQFAGVEQQINANEHLESLLGLTQASISASAVSYIGKQVQAESNTLPLQDGGPGKFTYTLTDQAKEALVIIKDSSGKVVRTLNGDTESGTHHMTWDGKDSKGNEMPDGAYTLEVQATKTDGSTMSNIYTTTTGIATSVASDGNDVLIAAGPVLFGMNYIISVSDVPAKTPDTGDSGSGETDGGSDSADGSGDGTGSTDGTTDETQTETSSS
jgi:flagellar basal-body rod modification protein FlgD